MPRRFTAADLHEEWRLLTFVFLYGTVCALCWLVPDLAIYLLVVGAGTCVIALRRLGAANHWFMLAVGVFVAAGLSAARLTTYETYRFEPEQFVMITGRVETLDHRPEKPVRLKVKASNLAGFKGPKAPEKLRLSVRTEIGQNIRVGSLVTFQAVISPVGGALEPGGYDFGRAATYSGIHARGFAVSDIRSIGLGVEPLSNGTAWLSRLRYKLAQEISNAVPGQPGALAVALILGLRQGISDTTSETLRRAGLSHLLAISGLHMGIVAAVTFFVFEFLFAAMPAIALRIMPRKLAVLPAWTMAAVYLLLSGGSVATIRAFIMVSVAMLALLAGRRVLSLRSVALAALAILVVWPESVLTVGFQMSFAATAGLIAFYERIPVARYFGGYGQSVPVWRRAAAGLVMIGITSLVAQVAVSPFALYHFQAISLVGIAANMAVLPIVSFLLMPLLLAALFLTAFSAVGLVGPLVYAVLKFIMVIAEFTASPDYSVFRIGPMSDLALFVLVTAFLVLLIIVTKKGPILASLLIGVSLLVPGREAADILISKSGGVIAVHRDDQVVIAGGRKSSFRSRSWRRYWGYDPYGNSAALRGEGGTAARRYEVAPGQYITRVKYLSAVHQACAGGGIVILLRKYARYCKGAALIIEKEKLEEFGPAGIKWPGADTYESASVAELNAADLVNAAEKPVLLWSNPPDDLSP